ncbi:MAG: PilW family protein [Acidiferrobacterales bacterium]
MTNHITPRPTQWATIRSKMRGFTLVEILVATSIGLIILAAVSQIFVTSRSTFTLEEGLARLQENGRFSMEFIGQDVRMSGNLGCLQKYSVLAGTIVDPVTNQLNNNTDYGWDFSAGQHLRGHTYTGGGTGTTLADWTPALPGTINGLTYFTDGDVSAKSDVLMIRRALTASFKLSQATTATGPVRIADPGTVLQTNDIVLITDCNGGDIFQITGITPSGPDVDLAHVGGADPGNVATDLSRAYGINSEVSQVVTRVYYVGPGTDGVTPTLYRKDISSGAVSAVPPQPLVDNVEIMRVLYGEDTDSPSDNQANIYRQANNVVNWTDVVSMRIALLVRTAENSGPDFDTKTYNLAGISVDPTSPAPDDRRQRRVFTSTIQLRNPIP